VAISLAAPGNVKPRVMPHEMMSISSLVTRHFF
jgi:hypothetical protein